MAAFTEVMICLNDLMVKSDKFATRISFTDDVDITPEVYDATELIIFVRDAVCHIGIYNHFVVPNKIKAGFNVAYGKGSFPLFTGFVLVCPYENEVTFHFGLYRIYLVRHIIRAFEEAQKNLLPLLVYATPTDVVRH